MKVWSIIEWLTQTRQWLEQNYQRFWIQGEVSNFTQASSGHLYFVLKEGSAQIKCVLFRSYAQRSTLKLQNGLKIEALAQATIYEERGELQLRLEEVRDAGLGDLWQRFLVLKAKLEALGWFNPEHKRDIPLHPRRIGVITSLHAAALRDVVSTLKHRAPSVSLILYPTPVQGEEAPRKIAAAIYTACQRAEVDTLLLCRGGGSLDDLAAFNHELVAKAIFEATLPIISGIGHETDFTIADFVADKRAPTPTGAVVLAVPDEIEQSKKLEHYTSRLLHHAYRRLEHEAMRLDHLSQRLKSPRQRLITHRQQLDQYIRRWRLLYQQQSQYWHHSLLSRFQRFQTLNILPAPATLTSRLHHLQLAQRHYIQTYATRLKHYENQLQTLHPLAPLERGYAMVTKLPEEEIVTSIKGLAAKQALQVSLRDGSVNVTITSITPHHEREPIQD
ncbi:MAG: exodeoxyribonuclease VII large subunit [Pseudomonadota bacterium]